AARRGPRSLADEAPSGCRRRPSEARQIRERTRLAGVHMLAPELGTAVQRRKHLAGIEAQLRIERAFHTVLDLEIGRIELIGHEVALLEADTVLARQHTPNVDAQLQYLVAELLCPLELARHIGVVQDQRMQVAVARV